MYSASSVRDLFDRMSRSYERVNTALSLGFSVLWRRRLARLVPPQPADARILDAMCGMGETWTALVRRFPGTNLVALDFSSRMVDRARARSAARHGGKIAVVQNDMLVSGLSDGSLDVLVSAYGVKTFDRLQTELFVEELARILKPGGHFALIEVTEPPHRILRALYRFYIGVVVPRLARLLVAETEEYRMLARYLRAYGDGERTAAALASHPLLTVETRRHFFGCATSFNGRRVVV
ncbi:hypothetical protein LK09_15845 [Microbacterium mangrovi]|uniref:Demethylmenaquinone methyltransferase n=1 Tax=Microbacterium mangrovi TaxID=1348253 RepID=A0A0B2A4C0_9MICO|nr:hypothetical protein LK09_15845 [Microbacterium mangrovi]